MQITKLKQLKVGEVYFMYKIHLTPFLTSIQIKPPTEYKYLGKTNNPKKPRKKDYLQFVGKTKRGHFSKPKEVYLSINNADLYFGTGIKCYSSYAEACENFDQELEKVKQRLFESQRKMKEIYDSIDNKKIRLREFKIKRLI